MAGVQHATAVTLTAIELEDQALGDWPRRLLHVPSMTSHEWQPGNIYGLVREPTYNALTYTWGRWRLGDSEQPWVKAIRIQGVSWEIPRIDPRRFTAAQFASVIQKATQSVPQWKKPGVDISEEIEYLWLDMACIDQRGSNPKSAAEIGRQLPIFKNARQVFSWLHELPSVVLGRVLTEVDRMTDELPNLAASRSAPAPVLNAIYQNLSLILDDPWFSSLWTLQEAFLRPDCILFSKEGKTRITTLGSGAVRHDTFLDLLGCCENVLFCESSSLPEPFGKTVSLVKEKAWPLS
ncbi:hypothetical protein PG999_001299 [Apiospora kogelbergensis]|uniref:Heterokaryon incompatibility domain-containing protein n=1 Tax=Apiospora kogelbergensis TaxID=1337665 RepID=A0AAW0RED4_9PEZI